MSEFFSIILAAGQGSRLRPLTDAIPKPLVEVRGRPCIDWTMTSLLAAGVRKNCIVVGYLAPSMRAHFQTPHFASDSVVFATQEALTGTADAVQAARQVMKREVAANLPVIITAADYFMPPEFFREMLHRYTTDKPDILIATRLIRASDASRKSTVSLDAAGNVLSIHEKPKDCAGTVQLSAALVLIAPVQILAECDAVERSERGEREIQSAISKMICNGSRAISFQTNVLEDLDYLI